MRPTTQKELDAQYAADKAKRALETPGETEARLRREMEPVFKEVADFDQMKYEMEEYHKEKVIKRFTFYSNLTFISRMLQRHFVGELLLPPLSPYLDIILLS